MFDGLKAGPAGPGFSIWYNTYMLKQEIAKIIEGDIDDSPSVLEKYSRDYSIFSIRPELVVYPKHVADIGALVRFAHKINAEGYYHVTFTARGAGTDMTGGPLTMSVVLDMTRYMTGVVSVERGKFGTQKSPTGHDFNIAGKAVVRPGTFYRDFEKETLKQGLIMPCYPASRELATVGGMVANNGAGEKTLKYGQNKDFVERLKVVLDDGNEYEVAPLSRTELEAKILEDNRLAEIYRKIWNLCKRNMSEIAAAKPNVNKNSSGYLIWDVWNQSTETFDPTKLFVGAQGTTGIITEITYRLVEVETRSKLLVVFVKNLQEIPALTAELMKNDVETLEVYDDHTLTFALKFFRSFVRNKGFFGTIAYGFKFLPELFMMLTGGIPKLIVLAEFVSNSEEGLISEVRVAESRIKGFRVKTRITKTAEERDKYFHIRRDSFKLLSDHSKNLRTAPFIDDVIVPVARLPEYLPKLTEILDREKMLYTIAGHLGNGNLHVIPLMDFRDPKTLDIIKRVSKEVFALVKTCGGSMTAEHNDGLIRTPYLALMFGEVMVGIFREMKEIMDPNVIWNPKKKVGLALEESHEFIRLDK